MLLFKRIKVERCFCTKVMERLSVPIDVNLIRLIDSNNKEISEERGFNEICYQIPKSLENVSFNFINNKVKIHNFLINPKTFKFNINNSEIDYHINLYDKKALLGHRPLLNIDHKFDLRINDSKLNIDYVKG
jgi:hypothetical protein